MSSYTTNMPREPRGTSQYCNWCFTYFPEDQYLDGEWPEYLWQPEHMKYLLLGKEICPTTGNRHFQCFVQLKTKKTLSWLKTNVDDLAHFEPCKGTSDQNYEYCTKDGDFKEYGVRCGVGQRNDINAVCAKLDEGKTVDELMLVPEFQRCISRCINFFRQYQSNIARTKGRASLDAKMSNVVLRDWQTDLNNICSGAPDSRKVYWYFDEYGNTGKSFMVDYLVSQKGGIVFTNGKMADIAYAYGFEPIVIFDLSRCQAEKIDNIYMAVENFKNGRIFSPKYESQNKIFDVPHVVVFANFAPDRSKLSEDRWVVRHIGVDV